MRCSKIRKQLDLLMDRALDANSTAKLEEHLKSCIKCRNYHQANTRLQELMNQPLPPFPKHIHHQVLELCKEHDAKRVRLQKRARLQLVPATLAVMLSLFIGSLVGKTIFTPLPFTAPESVPTEELSFGDVTLVDYETLLEADNE